MTPTPRHFPFPQQAPAGPATPGWDVVLVGYDFGLLDWREIQGWVRRQCVPGPNVRALLALRGEALAGFEAALWDAVAEITGATPRPGHRRWCRAQDWWRAALLQEALDRAESPEDLAARAAAVYDQVGCPEDMLPLWTRPPGGGPAAAQRHAILAFIQGLEVLWGQGC